METLRSRYSTSTTEAYQLNNIRRSPSPSPTREPAEQSYEPWRANSWRTFPFLAVLSLCGAVVTISLAILLLVLADDSLVEDWPLAPTVYLSILATFTGAFLRFAFHESADIAWWSRLLTHSSSEPDHGTTLRDLQTAWDLTYNVASLLNFRGVPLELHLRLTALLVLVAAVSGPLLQRAITVEIVTRTSVRDETLPIRQEPVWNFTTKIVGSASLGDSAPPYQDEFADAVKGLNQRRPMRLSASHPSVCSDNSTCTTNVVVAGFAWNCRGSRVSLRGVPSLGLVERLYLPPRGRLFDCPHTGYSDPDDSSSETSDSSESSYTCGYLDTEFQFDLRHLIYPDLSEGDTPWLAQGSPPATFNYTTYVREDRESDMLSVRRCNLSTAFVELPIEISEGRTVTLLPQNRSSSTREGLASIPRIGWFKQLDPYMKSFVQVIEDLYAGFILFDREVGLHHIQGLNSRQLIDQSTITQRNVSGDYEYSSRYTFACRDPFEDVMSTLDELSLRYALQSIPETEERLSEISDVLNDPDNVGSWERRLDVAEALAKAGWKPRQTMAVSMTEKRALAAYRAHYAFTGVAMGITYLATLLTALLLRGFRFHGRVFSFSPLEIAKAFDAPLLRGVGSNSRGGDIATGPLSDVKLRYGEVLDGGDSQATRYDSTGEIGDIHVGGDDVLLTTANEKPRLVVEVAERVRTPVNGRVYA